MGGTWWRLLAAVLLILLAGLLRAQNADAGRGSIVPADSESLLYSPAGNGWVSPFPGNLPLPVSKSYPHPPTPVGFGQIAQPAGIIFSGTVTAIKPVSPKGPNSTAVTFKVSRAIRGVSAGQSLTIHEWAGLWSRGERYRVGERVFLFLYAPSRLGLTSPVASGMGRFGVDVKGRILLTPQHVLLFANHPILGGKNMAAFSDFALAVQQARFTQ